MAGKIVPRHRLNCHTLCRSAESIFWKFGKPSKDHRSFQLEEQNPFVSDKSLFSDIGYFGEWKKMEEYDLLQCIEKGLEPFGSHVKQSIYWKMSILHNYSRTEVIDNPDLLTSVIRETLSDSSPAVEESIAAEVREKFNLSIRDSKTMSDAIVAAKRQIIGLYVPAISIRP
jgi:hypothetical protein